MRDAARRQEKVVAAAEQQTGYEAKCVAWAETGGEIVDCGIASRLNLHDNAVDRERLRSELHERRAVMAASGGSYTVQEWLSLCAEYNDCCACCGLPGPLAADHVIPVHLGGSSNISNIQPLCKVCNSRKGIKKTDYRKTKRH